ncbi:MAG: LacI family transcriptional regulator [Clostridiales bacterium]|nr:LacI family transcriptional regulator [Clostridiales bacterium]
MASNLKDIADQLGISVSTVSRVVNGKYHVSQKMRGKVLSALEKHDYVPNQIARSLKAQNTKTVGIIVPDIREYFSNVIKGADAILYESGYTIMLADTGESREKEEHYLRVLFERRIDGLILATVSDKDDSLKPYFDRKTPIVFFDNLPDLSVPFNAVMLDNYLASKMAVDHLAEMGHRKIAIICGDLNETTAKERMQGYRLAMMDNRLAIDEVLIKSGRFEDESGYRSMKELVGNRAEHDFSAVYITTYKMTCGALRALKDLEMRCPEDVAVLGFDFTDESGLIAPKITSIVQPIKTIGEELAHRLIAAMRHNAKRDDGVDYGTARKIILAPTLKIGESSRCAANR